MCRIYVHVEPTYQPVYRTRQVRGGGGGIECTNYEREMKPFEGAKPLETLEDENTYQVLRIMLYNIAKEIGASSPGREPCLG